MFLEGDGGVSGFVQFERPTSGRLPVPEGRELNCVNIYRCVEGVKIDEAGPHFDSDADSNNRMEQGISRMNANTPGVAGIIPQRWPCLSLSG